MKIHRCKITVFAIPFIALLANASLIGPSHAASFTSTGNMNASRYEHTETLLPNGKVLIAGGYSGGTQLASAELYDPITGTWTSTGSLSAGRYSHTATLLPNGKVLVAGGLSGSVYLSSVELYDPAAGTWSSVTSMNTARRDHMAILLPNGDVLIAAGYNGSGYLSSAEMYNPTSEAWAATGSLTAAGLYGTATLLPNGKVLVVGGQNPFLISRAELYDPDTRVWTATESLATARRNHTATLLPNGNVLVAAGQGSSGYLFSAEVYDWIAETWTATDPLITARYLHAAMLLPNGKVLISGGYNTSGYLSAAELFDPTTGTWTSASSLNTARRFHTATLLPNGNILVAAGQGSSGLLSSAELYSPDPSLVSFLPKDDVIVKYGTLTWKRASAASEVDVIFYPKVAFKLEPFTRPVAQGGLGRVPLVGEAISFTQTCSDNDPTKCMFTMCWDVTNPSLTKAVTDFRVLSVSQEDDWVLCQGTEPYTYGSAGVYEAGFYACRRPLAPPNGDQRNRASTSSSDFGMEVHVRLDTQLPVSAQREKIDMPPVMWVWPDENGEVRVPVPASKPSPSYFVGLGNPNQAGINNHGHTECYKPIAFGGTTEPHPPGLFIDNGEVYWTSVPSDGDWTVQLTVEDDAVPQLTTIVDLIFRIKTAGQNKIVWSEAPPPVIEVAVGSMVNFKVSAQHVGYTGGQFTITSGTLPYGAMLIPSAPVTRQNQLSVSTAFAWIPSGNQLGSHIVHFIAGNTASNPDDESRAYGSVIIKVRP